MTKVSVIMGIYNCEQTLPAAIESLIEQTFEDLEIIMCDDGSTDSTLTIAKQYEKKFPEKIILLVNEKNRGLNYTLNRCIEKCTGKYIARQDADDYSDVNRLKKQVDFLENNEKYSIVGSGMNFFNEGGVFGQVIYKSEPEIRDLIKGSPFAHPTVLMRSIDLIESGKYDERPQYMRVEDYHLWVKFYSRGLKGYNLKDPLYYYREDNNAYSRRNFKNRINESRLKWNIYKDFSMNKMNLIYIVKPILTFLVPKFIYSMYRGYKYRKD